MANKPVLFLAFANDRVDNARYLRNLPKELDGLRKALYLAEQMGLCEVVERANVTIDQIVNVFQDPRYRDRVAIFHYGGHANGYQLLLETLDDNNIKAEAGGLVPFFARQKSLQLVFLNGCSSRAHAVELIEAGIPAVVGTAEPINDAVATQLAVRFYKGLAGGLPLQRAWAEAEDEIKMGTRKGDYRGLVMDGPEEADGHARELPWELHRRPGAEQVMDWSLPAACGDPLFGLPGLPADIQPPEEPFLFFKRYERKDAAVFFGRSSYIRDLYNRVTDPEAPPLILLYGQSGVGKSSLLDTGLRPRLEHAHQVVYIRRRPEWGLTGSLERALAEALPAEGPAASTPPPIHSHGESPLSPALQELIGQLDQNLKALEDKAGPQHKPYLEQLKAMQEHGAGILRELQKEGLKSEEAQRDRRRKLAEAGDTQTILYRWIQAEAKLDRPLVIILDQVEEVFTRPSDDPEELNRFLSLLQSVFQQPGMLPQGKLMLAYRKEYQPEIEKGCKAYALPRSQVFLERLKREEIIEVIQGLALTERLRNWYHLSVEAHLPGMVADDLLSDRDSPVAPILQILVTKLWNKAKAINPAAPEFSVQLYQELKEDGILLDEFFEQQVAQLAQAMPEAVTSGLLLDLLNYHTTPLGTADSRSLEDIRVFYNHRQEEIGRIIQRCKDLYLLSDAGPKVSLSHDTLAPLVQKAFRESDAPGQRAYRILDNKMLDFDPENLATTLDPIDLALVEKGENGMRFWQPRERELVRLSRLRREKEERARRIRWIIFGIGMLAIAGLGIFSFFQKQEADIQRANAFKERDNAVRQEYLADSNRQVAVFQESLAVNNQLLAEYRTFQADSSGRVAESERDNALLQQRIARSEALANKARLLLTSDDPAALATAVQAWQAFPSDGTYGVLLEAYHHSPVPKTMAAFEQRVAALAGSPDHQWLAAGLEDGKIQLLDVLGRAIPNMERHSATVNGLAFSNTHLASVSEDRALLIFRLSNPVPVVRVKLEEPGESVHFFPDGNRFLVLVKNTLLTFSIEGKAPDSKILLASQPTAVALSPDGRSVLLGYPDGALELRRAEGGELLFSQAAHPARINSVGFSASGSQLVTTSNDSTVVIRDREGGNPLILKGHERRALTAFFFGRDRYLATAGADRTIRIWDARNGQPLLTLRGHLDEVNGLNISADGQTLYSSSSDRSLRAWPLEQRHQQVFTQAQGPVSSAAFWGRKNDQILIGQGRENPEIGWWNGLESYRGGGVTELRGGISAIAVAPDGKVAVGVSTRGEAFRWTDPYQPPELLVAGKEKLLGCYDVDVSRNWMAVGAKRLAFVWRKDGAFHLSFSHDGKSVDALAISPDEKTLITVSNDTHSAKSWRISDGKLLKEARFPAGIRMNDILFLPGGGQMLLAGDDGSLYRYTIATGQLTLTTMAHPGPVTTMALSPNSQYLLAASGYAWYLWDPKTGQQIYRHTGHSGIIHDVCFSPDGRYIVTASADGTARLWLVDVPAILSIVSSE
ncbi:MAG: AAA family ATPase [Lewinellaceae bacterium]|nr:AAA family ATPase [Lewinellaceae bacterium]